MKFSPVSPEAARPQLVFVRSLRLQKSIIVFRECELLVFGYLISTSLVRLISCPGSGFLFVVLTQKVWLHRYLTRRTLLR